MLDHRLRPHPGDRETKDSTRLCVSRAVNSSISGLFSLAFMVLFQQGSARFTATMATRPARRSSPVAGPCLRGEERRTNAVRKIGKARRREAASVPYGTP